MTQCPICKKFELKPSVKYAGRSWCYRCGYPNLEIIEKQSEIEALRTKVKELEKKQHSIYGTCKILSKENCDCTLCKQDKKIAELERRIKEKDKEICICAAIKTGNEIIRGHRHCDCFVTMQRMNIERGKGEIQGFITSKNRFVNRREAFNLQIEAGVLSADPNGYGENVLLSEDLY